jgi:hypothetical protein
MTKDQVDETMIALPGRCMTLHVPTAGKMLRFRSNQMEIGLSIARIVSRNINPLDTN